MEHTYISDLASHVGQTVELRGWIYNFRTSGKLKYLLVRDKNG